MKDNIYDLTEILGLVVTIISFVIFIYLIITGNSYRVVPIQNPLSFFGSYRVSNPIFDYSVLGIFTGLVIFTFGRVGNNSKDQSNP